MQAVQLDLIITCGGRIAGLMRALDDQSGMLVGGVVGEKSIGLAAAAIRIGSVFPGPLLWSVIIRGNSKRTLVCRGLVLVLLGRLRILWDWLLHGLLHFHQAAHVISDSWATMSS